MKQSTIMLVALSILIFAIVSIEGHYQHDHYLNGSHEYPLTCHSINSQHLKQFHVEKEHSMDINHIDHKDHDKHHKKCHIKTWKGYDIRTFMPCRFWALKHQQCGQFRVSIALGYRYIQKHHLDTLSFSIKNTLCGMPVEGLITNKQAVLTLNQYPGPTFEYVNSTLLESSASAEGIHLTAYNSHNQSSFRITFKPWAPKNKHYKDPNWKFECFEPNNKMQMFPDQMCGSGGKEYDHMRKKHKMPRGRKELLFYYSVFTNKDIEQTNPQCQEASHTLLQKCKSKEMRIRALKICMDTIFKPSMASCIARYNCGPMSAFNACLKWGCKGKGFDLDNKEECSKIANSVDFCPPFPGHGRLTDLISKAECYKKFLPIIPNSNVTTENHDG